MKTYGKLKTKLFNKLKKKQIKVISFDVFETILERIIPPDDTIKIAGKIFSDIIYHDTGIFISAEKIVADRKHFQSTQTTPHWSVSEWLKEFCQRFQIDEKIAVKGLECEMLAEDMSTKRLQYLNELVNALRHTGYVVIAISDTWLDKNLLLHLLQKKGFVFDQVYSSCEIKKSKFYGSIFKHIENFMGLPSSRFLHIGDNLKSDYVIAKRSGWESIWLPQKHPLTGVWIPKFCQKGFLKVKKMTLLYKILEKKSVNRSHSPLYKMAYEDLAPLVILFCFILNKKFQEQNFQTVFFIARDAHIFHEAYKLMEPFFKTERQIFYVRLSRKAVAACHPDNPLVEIKRVSGKTGNKNINNWLGSFAIDDDLKSKILRKANLTGIESLSEKNKICLEEACRYYRKELKSFVEDSKALLADFIRQHFPEGAFPERIGIVDSGWACTIQDSISNVLPGHKTSGFYFGVSHEGKKPDKKSIKYGLFRDDFRRAHFQNPLHASAGVIRVWDILLRENTATVASLKRTKNGSVIPVKKTDQSIGKIEREACDEILKGLLAGISERQESFDLLPKLINIWDIEKFEITANKFADLIAVYPDPNTAKEILKLGFDEGGDSVSIKNLGMRTKYFYMIWLPGILARIRLPLNILSLFSPLLLKMKNVYIKGKIRKR